MRTAVLRVSGPGFKPDEYLQQHGFVPNRVWRVGERGRRGVVCSESGFNLTVADGSTAAELINQVRAWLDVHRASVLALKDLGASAMLDLGVTVGSSEAFTVSISLQPADLAVLAETGVELCFSAYPSSD